MEERKISFIVWGSHLKWILEYTHFAYMKAENVD